jgi:nucleotide-binding universal stress UspA family protein
VNHLVSFSKMLVAIDGSMYSDYALNIALKIAEKYSSKLDLMHVVIPSHEQKEDVLGERMEISKERKLTPTAIKVESNDPSSEILKLTDGGAYDLVVMGSRGLSGLKSALMGSVSSKVAKEAKCSVLVVKTRISATPKILLGYDGSEESKKALEVATDLGSKLKARVDALSIFSIPVSPEAYVGVELDKWERDMRNELGEAVEKIKSRGVSSQGKIIEHTNVPLAIVSEAERGSYDLIVVGSRGMGRLQSLFLGSVASGIANNSKTNVLIAR